MKLVEATRTLCPVHFASSHPTYFNPIPKEKWSLSSLVLPGPLRCPTSGVDRRVRGTAGGDRLESSCPPAAHVASLPCVNLLPTSVVSCHAFFGSIDLTDYYLGTPLSHPQFIKIPTHLFSDSVLSHLHLHSFVKSDPSSKPYLLFRIDKTMYGLKEAVKLSQDRLLSHFAPHGFHQTSTPCLFSYVSHDIVFALVVDDFGVKYTFAKTLTSSSQLSPSPTMPKPTLSQPNFLALPSTTTAPSTLSPCLTLDIFPPFSPAFAPTGSVLPLPLLSTTPPPLDPGPPSPPLGLTFSLSLPRPIQGFAGSSRLPAVLRTQRECSHAYGHLRPRRRTGLSHPLYHDPP